MSFRLVFILLVFTLTACSSTTRDYKGVYEETKDLSDLAVPPGLDRPDTGSEYLPELTQNIKTYSGYEESIKGKPASRLEREYQGMNFVRSGSLFWLEVSAPGGEVWSDLRQFFLRLGFEFKQEIPQIGYLETNWRENGNEAPTGFLTSLFNSVFASSELMDKYRIRLEWDAEKKVSRVFINHQGMREIIDGEDDNISIVTTKWVPREADPELEVELLMRFMAFRGLSEVLAEENITSTKIQKVAEVKTVDDKSTFIINEPFARGWRHVGIALDRLGYLIEDKNRSAGVFYISLPETFVLPKEGGLFGGIFTSGTEAPTHLKYLIILEDLGETTTVKLKSNGEVMDDFSRVEKKIYDDLQKSIL